MKTTIAIAAIGFTAAVAAADISSGPIFAKYDATFTVDLVSSSAGWTGELSRLSNTESEDAPAQLLSNKGPTDAAPTQFGAVSRGEAIYFQYEITRGTTNVFRQDDESGAQQFRHEWISLNTARLFVEDTKLPGGDHDYNDAVYDVTFTPVPTPGVLAMSAISGGLLIKRRRNA